MYSTSFIKKILLVATVVLLYSCDKDFNAIGDGLINDDHFGLESEKYDVLAYNQEVTPVQSNGLATNPLGIYSNPVFGETISNFVTQVGLSSYAPTIGADPEVISVVLTIPYFSHKTATDDKGASTYVLDSIFGDEKDGRIKLSVYESGVQMRGSFISGGSQFPQLYYTDQDAGTDPINFDTSKGVRLNDDADKSQNDEFFFNPAEIVDVTKDEAGKDVTTRVAPEMRLKLNAKFFETKILKADASKLSSPDLFQEYFRGLYFKVEKSSASATTSMALLNFALANKAIITIKYKAKTAITTDPEGTTEEKSLVINLGGATASLQQSVKNAEYETAIASRNKTTGDERLYLKGGQGSLAVIELNGFASKLDEIRKTKWLVNEANLVFTIDSDKMKSADEPKRIYLYDLDNNIPIVDYADGSSGSLDPRDPKTTRYIYDGMIKVDATTKRGTTYKIRLTNHIRNLIKDAAVKNVRLGLVVTEDIAIIASNKLKLKNDVITDVPRASVMSPLGTILFGGNIPSTDANFAKRIQLQVYYTKPN